MFDAIVIGGSFAGLSAALQLARASRSVLVVDEGQPRNLASAAAHGVPGWDGVPPADILARFRSDVAAYPTVSFMRDTVTAMSGGIDAFAITTTVNGREDARRIVLAHGVRDILPDLPGLDTGWGRTVLHCPYCHGYEVKGRPLAVLATGPMAAHQALMLRADWSDDVTLIVNDIAGLDVTALEAAGVKVEVRRPQSVAGEEAARVRFEDGADTEFAALFLGPRIDISGSPAEMIGVGLADGPMGPYVRAGAMQQTDVPGVFAAGDIATPMWNVNFAVGDGARAGAGCHQSLLFPDFVQPLDKVAA